MAQGRKFVYNPHPPCLLRNYIVSRSDLSSVIIGLKGNSSPSLHVFDELDGNVTFPEKPGPVMVSGLPIAVVQLLVND